MLNTIFQPQSQVGARRTSTQEQEESHRHKNTPGHIKLELLNHTTKGWRGCEAAKHNSLFLLTLSIWVQSGWACWLVLMTTALGAGGAVRVAVTMVVCMRVRMLVRLPVRIPGLLHDAVEGLRQCNVLWVQAAALEICLRSVLPLFKRLRSAPLPEERLHHQVRIKSVAHRVCGIVLPDTLYS
jgi:hypothetical protein